MLCCRLNTKQLYWSSITTYNIYFYSMPIPNAAYWINRLKLQPHPEGGYYTEVFRSEQLVKRLDKTDIKQACTSIYYLLEGKDFSGFHRIGSDEIWYFHKGVPLLIHVI